MIGSPTRPKESQDGVPTAVAASPGHRLVVPADLTIALWAAAGLAATYYLAVRTRTGQVLDAGAMDLTVRALLGVRWTGTLLALISPASVLLAVTTLGVLAWALKGAAAAVEAGCTAVGTLLAAIGLKALLQRPTLLDDAANSLPSGHVAAVAGMAAAIALLTGRGTRPVAVVAGVGAVALTGTATLALGWHRPSDVLASALVAVAVAATTRWTVAACGPSRHGARSAQQSWPS